MLPSAEKDTMSLRSRVTLALAAAALGAAATPAGAQQGYLYYNACGGARGNASLVVCASADIQLVGSTLRMRVWNMEVAGGSGMSSYSSQTCSARARVTSRI
jgi:hypothetical protein